MTSKPPGLSKFIKVGIALLLLFAIGYAVYYFFINAQINTSPVITVTPTPTSQIIYDPAPSETVFCTMDAKLCPDGSSVGRGGPNCEFAPCPEN